MTVHYFDAEDLAAVKRVLDSGRLCSTDGPVSRQFEEAFEKAMGVHRAVALNSAMSALHCALAAAGAGAGQEVICDPMVQFGSMAVFYHNAVPVFADVDPDTQLIDPESIRERITERTKAIVCTHLWGLPCDMDPIMKIAEEHGLAVIEDNAHGLYGEYKGRLTGTLGHMAAFSFQMSKQMALGDAGMATTMDPRFTEALLNVSGTKGLGALFPSIAWNYRLNEVIAALGIVQLQRAKAYVESGIANAQVYNEALRGVELIRPQFTPADRKHAYHIWVGTFEGARYGISLERFKEAVAARGVHVGIGYIQKPAYLHDVYTQALTYGRDCPLGCPLQMRRVEYKPGLCPVAEDLMPRLLLIHTGGTLEGHKENAEKLLEVVRQFQ